MLTFFIFLSALIAIIENAPLENLGLINSTSNDNIDKISSQILRLKRQFNGCGQRYCCCATLCCCAQSPQSFSPSPPITLPPMTTRPPVAPLCCQISQRICCQPSPMLIQTGQMLMPQPQVPQTIPMIGQGAPIQQLSPQIVGKQICCNCCPCFGAGRKRRSIFSKLAKLK
ncbi:unnamed protein product [Acanthocheilonema viteae]|uniref:Uncharacterized protein n=1 Tax=Acanthocheilonema viteae TaxID=6277 RepID=A0A498SKI2_ACAVI|nr:unnamed protein product [Acanthocheilonema viteae]